MLTVTRASDKVTESRINAVKSRRDAPVKTTVSSVVESRSRRVKTSNYSVTSMCRRQFGQFVPSSFSSSFYSSSQRTSVSIFDTQCTVILRRTFYAPRRRRSKCPIHRTDSRKSGSGRNGWRRPGRKNERRSCRVVTRDRYPLIKKSRRRNKKERKEKKKREKRKNVSNSRRARRPARFAKRRSHVVRVARPSIRGAGGREEEGDDGGGKAERRERE